MRWKKNDAFVQKTETLSQKEAQILKAAGSINISMLQSTSQSYKKNCISFSTIVVKNSFS